MAGASGRADNPLVTKLSHFAALSDTDIGVLDALCSKQERFGPGVNLVNEGDPPRSAFVITRGLACRYRILADGRRQILTFLMPGDFFDLHVFLLKGMDHSVITMTPSRLAAIARETVIDMVVRYPRLGAALWWCGMQEAAMLRERIVMLGRRNARARVAYLLSELVWRYRSLGLNEDHAIRLPLTQTDIADTLGLTPVHVNRVLQEFRRDGLITLMQRHLRLHDAARLQELAGLTKDYLHLGGMPIEAERYLDALELAAAATGLGRTGSVC